VGQAAVTNVQLYLSIGIPTLAVLVGILLNGFLYNSLNTSLNGRIGSFEGRIGSLEGRIGNLEGRIGSLETRIGGLETRMASLETTMTARFDLIMGKLVDLYNRLTVLEDRGKR
jgi:hypothetical protein